jgi:hypothetical protein
MRKLNIGIISAIFLFLSSCNKKDKFDGTQSAIQEENSQPGHYTANNADFETDIIAYNLLSASECYDIWAGHLQKAKTQFTFKNESIKANMVDYLLNNLTESVFDDGSYTQTVFLNYFVPTWIDSAESIFTEVEFYDLTVEPYLDTIGVEREISEPDGNNLYAMPKCFCHTGARGYSCTRVQIGFPTNITFGNCERTNADCRERARGCGFMWLSSCDGNHCQY